MPIKPQDTSNDKLHEAAPDVVNGGRGKSTGKGDRRSEGGVESEPNQVNYGFGQNAELNTEAEETSRQEYSADGMQRMSGYSAHKMPVKGHEQGERKGPSDRV